MNLKLITDVQDLKGKYVLVRSSLNVPLDNGTIRDDFRLKRAMPTLRFLREQGAKTIIISHIGREEHETLKPVFDYFNQPEVLPMTWGGKVTETKFTDTRDSMKEGDIVMCENLRQDKREEKNDKDLAEFIANFGDIYVNDAFAAAHREHVSTYGVGKLLPAYAGMTLAEEVEHLTKMMNPCEPSILLLGGAKFETKMPLVEKYLALYDHIFIGGALAHDVMKARGLEIGKSLVSDISLADSPFLWSEKLMVPVDVVVEGTDGNKSTKSADSVSPDEKIFDLGEETIMMLKPYLEKACAVLWNGPFGNYEFGYSEGTEALARIVAGAEGISVIGGGDTVASVNKLDLAQKFEFVSIGGGAMLTFLEHGTTPAIELLRA
ncbi:MAG: phosphoglycerate kinase [Candidatus Nomurabacteria bacterium]|nr:MAG: phosphoglycerate kinase [Candidatus Nomurabacteria bacterium]